MSDQYNKTEQAEDIPLYLSRTGPCPYLPDRTEQTIFTRMDKPGISISTLLVQLGFRRSHNIYYRPQCPGCNACTPIRVPVASFHPTKTQRKIWRRNADLSATVSRPQSTEEHFDLFRRYTAARHETGGMADMTFDDFKSFMEQGASQSRLLHLRNENGVLKGAILYDVGHDGLSAVYSYFDPAEDKRSLGTHLVLSLIEQARITDKLHVYLGYWIAESPKMAYKTAFRPYELFKKNHWVTG